MTLTRRSTADLLDERADTGLYLGTLGACVASALMLFAPPEQADGFMTLAWSCMAASAACLAVKVCIRLAASWASVRNAGRLDA